MTSGNLRQATRVRNGKNNGDLRHSLSRDERIFNLIIPAFVAISSNILIAAKPWVGNGNGDTVTLSSLLNRH